MWELCNIHRTITCFWELIEPPGPQTEAQRWKTHNNEQKLMTLSIDEFLRPFLLHLLPKSFVRIRHFGLLASRRRAQLLPLCLAALDSLPAQTESGTSPAQDMSSHWSCPRCGGPMVIIERLTAVQIQLRSPPKLSIAPG